MLTKVISSDTIDGAVEQILDELKEDARSSGRHNVIYFDGWDGLGASAVLRAVRRRLDPAASQENQPRGRGPAGVGRRLAPQASPVEWPAPVGVAQTRAAIPAGLEFSHIFHIDCSKWESRRAMQRMIAKQLKLPASVMEMLDAQDEDDDYQYQGVAKVSRAEIPQVAGEIYEHVQKLVMNRRFLVIFHNGSNEEIDLNSFGFPLSGYLRNKVLWSFQGRFRVYPKTKVDRALMKNARTTTGVVLSAETSQPEEGSSALEWEADDVACEIEVGGTYGPAAAGRCFLLMMSLCGMGNCFDNYDLATHGCNYWVCEDSDVLLRGGRQIEADDKDGALWRSAETLHCEMRLDEEYYRNPRLPSPVVRRFFEPKSYWSSPTYGFMRVPEPYGWIPNGMFQHFNLLSVLKLSECIFNVRSPPFLCCDRLRFLQLDHCKDEDRGIDEAVKEDMLHRFLRRLWVLDVRYSDRAFLSRVEMDFMTQLRELIVMGERVWEDVDRLQRRMPNIRRLRVKDCPFNPLGRHVLSGRDKMELFEFSGVLYSIGRRLSVESSCSSLETVIINGPTDLKEISLTGCAKLKNLFLGESFRDLGSIHIIGAAVEILDLSRVTAPKLYELFLLDCEKLCAILWPSSAEGRRKRYLDKLRIDTTQKEGTGTTVAGEHRNAGREFAWHISVRDARILRSLAPVKDYFGPNHAHVEISSPSHPGADAVSWQQHVQVKLNQLKDTAIYTDVTVAFNDTNKKLKQAANEGDCDSPAIMCMCPPPPNVPPQGCYLNIEDHLKTKSQAASITLPGFICDGAKVLHVHDSLHITSILAAPLASSAWNQLEWCRVQGCPKLECVFSEQLCGVPEGSGSDINMFEKLRTTWASHLPNTCNIWKWSGPFIGAKTLLRDITLLHLDCCPRLISIFDVPMFVEWLSNLETLEIMWCGDLSVAFHMSHIVSIHLIFLKLKHIHLHELPKLWNIVNTDERIPAHKLKTIKIRGCWSLRTLPVVCRNEVVVCDCEKEWWDRLEWESAEHASQYKPIHPRYYKKTMLRGSVLR